MQDETVQDETVQDETVQDETVQDETVQDEMIQDEVHMPSVTRFTGRHRHRTAVAVAAATTLVAAAVAGCSGDGEGDKSPSSSATPASRICDGTLDAPAAAALERIGGTKEFEELTGTTEGQSRRFRLSRAATHLHDDLQGRSRCTVFVSGSKSNAPLVEIDFRAVDYDLDPAKDDKDQVHYPMGRYASTEGNRSAELLFTCATTAAGKKTPYVKADMYSPSDQIQPKATPKDQMVVLNSVSRHLAEELGCTAEAKLPSTVPDAGPAQS